MITKNLSKSKLESIRSAYGQALVELGAINKDIVVLSSDLTQSSRTKSFKETFPNRFFETGVAEQNMMGVAAGMALSGKIPFVNSFAVFSPGRNWEQLRISVGYSKANVKIAGHYAGFGNGSDGATHQAFEDIALTRVIPNLTVISPCDAIETKKAVKEAVSHKGPVYLRLSRNDTPIITTPDTPFKIGQAQVLKEGSDATIVVTGPILYQALMATKELAKEKIKVEVINNPSIKPLDTNTILNSVKKTHCLVTVEEHQIAGGMGSAILESLATTYAAPITEMIAMNDSFGESGKTDELMKKYHLDTPSIIKAVKRAIARKKRL